MSKQIAKNTFTGGLLMDLHPLSSLNTILTNALNATLVTIDGDEMILQNDLGNLKIFNEGRGDHIGEEKFEYVKISDGFIPIGLNSFNGIAYIVSYNPSTLEGEIGTFPSPNYNLKKGYEYDPSENMSILEDDSNEHNNLINAYRPLYNLYRGCTKEGCLGESLDLEVKGVLHQLRTTFFKFSLEHPVNIEIQPSYDGSVNLILNDGLNIPRLINSRFSVLENGTWEIPDRRRNNDNIYRINTYDNLGEFYELNLTNNIRLNKTQYEDSQSIFDTTTSLNKRISSFPIVNYQGVLNTGNLPVGNYVLYFKYCDEDGNETDFIGESSIISIFKGNDGDPLSIDGGERDMDSNKSIVLTLSLIDAAYSYVKVYYTRTSAAHDENRVTTAYSIVKPYPINDIEANEKFGTCDIIINGDEEKDQITLDDLNQRYYIVNASKTLAQTGNMLFLGNVKTADPHYKELTDISLRVIPYVKRRIARNKIGEINASNYTDTSGRNDEAHNIFPKEYYNTKNIYYNTGYWNEEYYRFGIVYIYEDGSLSDVYNILGYNTSTIDKNLEYLDSDDIVNTTTANNISDNLLPKDILMSEEENPNYAILQKEEEDHHITKITDLFDSIPPLDKKIELDDSGDYIDLEKLWEEKSVEEESLNYYINIEKKENKFTNPYILPDSLNSRGVLRIVDHEVETDKTALGEILTPHQYLYNIGIFMSLDIICYLKNELKIKGFFIVRQKRIPTILALGFTMPWDKEAKTPIIEYWDRRHDFYQGAKGSDEDKPAWHEKPCEDYYCGDVEGENLLGIWRRCDFVESFLQQNYHDAFGMANPLNENLVDDLDDENEDTVGYNRAAAVHHMYTPRLREILPLTIDWKMLSSANEAKELDSGIKIYGNVKFRVIADVKYVKGEGDLLTSETLLDYEFKDIDIGFFSNLLNSRATGSYDIPIDIKITTLIGTIKITTYLGCLVTLKHVYVDDGSGTEKSLDNNLISFLTSYDSYVSMASANLYTNYTNISLTFDVSPDGPDSFNPPADPGHEVSEDYFEVKTHAACIWNEAGNQALIIPLADVTNIADFSNFSPLYNDIKDGYCGSDCYLAGAVVDRMFGNIVNWTFSRNTLFFTAESRYYDVLYTYIPNYYMNRLLYGDLTWKDAGGTVAWTKGALNSGTSMATWKNFYLLYKYCNRQQLTAICPEFEVRQPFFNLLFTGSEYTVRYTTYQEGILHRKSNNERIYYLYTPSENEITMRKKSNQASGCPSSRGWNMYWESMDDGRWLQEKNFYDTKNRLYKIVSITENVPIVAIDNTIFKGALGDAAEAYRFVYIDEEHCAKKGFRHVKSGHDDTVLANSSTKTDHNLARGIVAPFLGMVCQENINLNLAKAFDKWEDEKRRGYGRTFTIYDNSHNDDFKTAANIRFLDTQPYHQISERICFDTLEYLNEKEKILRGDFVFLGNCADAENPAGIYYDLFRGDCYLCTFTHRVNRNFQDPSAPLNDKIVDPLTWKRNYDPDNALPNDLGVNNLSKINRGDINAVKLGSWVTVKVRSSYNLSIRSLDERNVTEAAAMGRARGYYPVQQASAEGGYKIPNSYVINDGFGSTLGEINHITKPEAPYYNNNFKNRILYSDVNITDSFKNGYRVFRYGSMQDYTKQYGQIIKLVEWFGDLVCVFEHGIALIPINERALAATGSGGEVYINNSNVLPDVLNAIISDKFGSQWADSIIKTPYYIYGVDSTTKKIWRTNGKTLLVLSDMRIEKFLKENLPIVENDTSVFIGLKNIKTHYNLTKSDVIFTFYMRNPNILGEKDEYAWSICLNEIAHNGESDVGTFTTFYSWIPLESTTINNKWYTFDREAFRGQLLSIKECCSEDCYKGKWQYKEEKEEEISCCKNSSDTDNFLRDANGNTIDKYVYTLLIPPFLWEHNNALRRPLPTHWYGKQHPFEFEFMVLEDGSVHKIFENLLIISNKAEPESFHFEITGDAYDFHEDKPNIFFRQEFLKNVYASLGSHWTYDKETYTKIHPNLKIKSTIFPLYYMRKDEYDLIYDNYQQMTNEYRDYQNLSGTEVFWNKRDHEFNLCTHIKDLPINGHWERCSKEEWYELYNKYISCGEERLVRSKLKKEVKPVEAFVFKSLHKIQNCIDVETEIPSNVWYYKWVDGGRLRGNSHYKEDKWRIQIPSITLMLKNEQTWPTAILRSLNVGEMDIEHVDSMGKYHDSNIPVDEREKISIPPMVLDLAHIPNDLERTKIDWEVLPNTYNFGQHRTDFSANELGTEVPEGEQAPKLIDYIDTILKWTNRKEIKIKDKYCKIKIRYSGEELAIISAILTTFNISFA